MTIRLGTALVFASAGRIITVKPRRGAERGLASSRAPLRVAASRNFVMCGIAGIIDLAGSRPVPPGILTRMADAITHRGPDEDGYLEEPGVGLANRRLS